jgi:hypothetical protein
MDWFLFPPCVLRRATSTRVPATRPARRSSVSWPLASTPNTALPSPPARPPPSPSSTSSNRVSGYSLVLLFVLHVHASETSKHLHPHTRSSSLVPSVCPLQAVWLISLDRITPGAFERLPLFPKPRALCPMSARTSELIHPITLPIPSCFFLLSFFSFVVSLLFFFFLCTIAYLRYVFCR